METDLFNYGDLTWPEISGLRRDIPLLLPLGEGYQMRQLAEALDNPRRAGLLPQFPFGWINSGLHLPQSLLETCLNNLMDSLQDQGFRRVYALTPQGAELNLGKRQVSLPVSLEKHASPLPPETERGKVILIPTGHTEQHAHHLPMSTDTLIIEAVSLGTARRIPEQAFSLPVMPYGVSMHHRAFAGTLSTGGRAFEDFWLAVIEQMVQRGFDRFYLMSGHGGNHSFLVNAVKYAGDRHPRIFCATAWLYLSGAQGSAALDKHRRSPIGGMGHACELETSLMLHLHPNLVHMERAVDETDFIATPSYYMDWVEGGALIANPPWDDDTQTGAYGAGSLATAEHGGLWLEAAIAEKIAHVGEIHEQHTRREARRNSGYGLWGAPKEDTHKGD